MQLSVGIVTYRHSYADLKPTIDSVLASDLDLKLYIIDNSPTRALEAELPHDPRIEYCYQNCNKGYGRGHNTVMRTGNRVGRYHLVLNPDVSFGSEVLTQLYSYMEANPDVGNVMPRVMYPSGEPQYLCKLLPRPIDWIGRMFLPGKWLRKRLNHDFEMHFADYDKEMNVPYLSGCFMFLRKSVLEEIGLFDERMFMYGEDVDLNRRIHRRYRTMYYPGVTIRHVFNRGSHMYLRLFLIHVKSTIYYMNKWGWFFDRERWAVNRQTRWAYGQKK